jgi:hypothetical protein
VDLLARVIRESSMDTQKKRLSVMTLRSVRDRHGREVLVEIGVHEWKGYRQAQENRDRLKSRQAASEAQKMFKDGAAILAVRRAHVRFGH